MMDVKGTMRYTGNPERGKILRSGSLFGREEEVNGNG